MALRALLIKPRKRGASAAYVGVNLEPLGLMQIAAFVRRFSRHAVALLDAQADAAVVEELADGAFRMGMPEAELRARLRAAAPDVVGISALFEVQQAEVLAIARAVRLVVPGALVVVGGLDAGIRFADYLASGDVDVVVRGDGEETFLDLLDRVARGAPLDDVPGTCVRRDGAAHANAARVPAVPFDGYPFAARDLLPRTLYDAAPVQRASFPFARGRPAVLLQGSRGCRLRCAFCDIVAVQSEWRGHSPEYVVDEIAHCVRELGAREVVFVDDNFMLNRRWAIRVFELVAARGLDVSLEVMAGVSVWTLTPEVIDTMVRAGVYRVCLPVESGNPETLRFIKKPIDLEKAVAMVEHCNRRGLYTFANLIVGFPFETRADVERTIAWGRRSGLDAIHYFIATPLPGARMYPLYEEHGWLVRHGDHVGWRTAHFTRDELERIADAAARDYLRARLRFLLRPRSLVRYVWPKLASWRRLRYALRLAARIVVPRGRRPIPAATSRDDAAAARLAVAGP